MKGQKSSRLDAVESHLSMQRNILEQLFNELQQVKNLAITTLETFKLTPGYDKAVADFKDAMVKLDKEKEAAVAKADVAPKLMKVED